jgi:hypothetical protein
VLGYFQAVRFADDAWRAIKPPTRIKPLTACFLVHYLSGARKQPEQLNPDPRRLNCLLAWETKTRAFENPGDMDIAMSNGVGSVMSMLSECIHTVD